jgi:hypothetical protein
MPLVGESSWDVYSFDTGNHEHTWSAHDWDPGARYLKIQCLNTSLYSTDGRLLAGGEAHIRSYSHRVGNHDEDVQVAPPWNYEAWDTTMTGVVWYTQVNRGFISFRLSIGDWA